VIQPNNPWRRGGAEFIGFFPTGLFLGLLMGVPRLSIGVHRVLTGFDRGLMVFYRIFMGIQ